MYNGTWSPAPATVRAAGHNGAHDHAPATVRTAGHNGAHNHGVGSDGVDSSAAAGGDTVVAVALPASGALPDGVRYAWAPVPASQQLYDSATYAPGTDLFGLPAPPFLARCGSSLGHASPSPAAGAGGSSGWQCRLVAPGDVPSPAPSPPGPPHPRHASRAVQSHPHGGQLDFLWLSARTPHGCALCVW